MIVYRLEHRSSGLGPFQHKSSRQKSSTQDALKYIYSDGKTFMPDLDREEVVKKLLLKYPKIVIFGWDSMEKLNKMIKDHEALYRLGFRVRSYTAIPLYRGQCGQIIFRRDGQCMY